MPGLRSSPGEGKGYPLQYSGLEKFDGLYSPWDHKESDNTTEQLSLFTFILTTRASLVAQLVRNLPAMWETWVRSLGWEDPLENGKATHSSILAWRIPWTTCIVHGVTKSQTQLSNLHFTSSGLEFGRGKMQVNDHLKI